jgi:hypothetical protein
MRRERRSAPHEKVAMNPRHAIALALVGWYLMVPGDNTKDPLIKWRVFRSFDTAIECQTSIDAHLEVLKKHEEDRSHFKTLSPQERLKEATKEAEWEYDFGNAQCIASDDPRLAK